MQPALVVETAPTVAAGVLPSAEAAPATTLSTAFCTNCGSKLEPGTGFCTNCGQPTINSSVAASEPSIKVATSVSAPQAAQPVQVESDMAAPATAEPTRDSIATKPVVSASSIVEPTPAAVTATPLVADRPVVAVPTKPAAVQPTPVESTPVKAVPVQPALQVAAPIYATASDYPPEQPGGGTFRIMVLILLLLIVLGGLGGWYFMGVETVIVCSPPDVKVFLDDKELPPTSYGRYVVPHLSRQPHLLRAQHPGFADTIERLDFPLISLHEWVNIKLVPRRPRGDNSRR
jgi:hypothetical protein